MFFISCLNLKITSNQTCYQLVFYWSQTFFNFLWIFLISSFFCALQVLTLLPCACKKYKNHCDMSFVTFFSFINLIRSPCPHRLISFCAKLKAKRSSHRVFVFSSFFTLFPLFESRISATNRRHLVCKFQTCKGDFACLITYNFFGVDLCFQYKNWLFFILVFWLIPFSVTVDFRYLHFDDLPSST